MSTKLSTAQINPEFEDLFKFKNKNEEIEHRAQMISYRILSEVEKICEEKKIKKKDLADKAGTSRSYITQLFRGNKQVNTLIMAKFESILDISFEIKAKLDEDSEEMFLAKQIPRDFYHNKKFPLEGYILYSYIGGQKGQKDSTNEIVNQMKTESYSKQKAG